MKRTRERSTTTRPRRWLLALAAMALLLASGVASALGLGQIELRSRIGEPLLAEIPIVSNDPRELQQLRVGLASSDTFARIGLQPPTGVVANLQFASALDARGNPVIRVTSREPITEPLLTFLVEVDWGQGRLVREYSVLLDAPRTVASPLQPPIEAPQAAPSNEIVRGPLPAPPEPEAEDEPPAAPAGEPGAEPSAADESGTRRDTSITPPPVPVAPTTAPAPAPAPAPAFPPSSYGRVRSGETLSEIAASLDLGVSLDQAMIALLRANPEAFIGDNVNLLKSGVVLRVPDRAELAAVDAVQASALVRSQVRQWRQAKQAVPQPVAAAEEPAAPADGNGDGDGEGAAGATPGARLEIIPPGASGAGEAGTQSGIAAGGEGDMQRELATTKETLAAREAELAEMKSRVAELEQLQARQQQLLEMQDTEMAAVEQRLAAAREADAGGGSLLPWLLGGAIGLVLALVVAWLLRRRSADAGFRAPSAAAPSRPSVADAYSFAPPPAAPRTGPEDDRSRAATAAAAPPPAEPAPQSGPTPAAGTASGSASGSGSDFNSDSDSDEPRPFWDRRERPPVPSGRAPAWHAGPATGAATGAAAGAATGHDDGVGAQERLELARAYLDLGDRDNARQLIDQVVADGDPAAREQAERMRRELDR